jgi:hypothetical protein
VNYVLGPNRGHIGRFYPAAFLSRRILRAGRTLIVLPLSEFWPEEEARFRTHLVTTELLRS